MISDLAIVTRHTLKKKEKIDKFNFIRNKKNASKDTIKKVQRQFQDGRKYLQIHVKGFVPRMCNSYNSIMKGKCNLRNKKRTSIHFLI